jgi:DNA-binding GntR family transcriptional regulator
VSAPLERLAAPRTLAAHTRRAVLAAIADGRLEPGGRYSVAQLAEQLGISRTPVREALLVLEREGRVRFERNKGVRVLETTATDVAEVFELRLLLEVPAAAKACGERDAQEASAEHRAILAALEAGDADRAAAAMRYHLLRTAELAGATPA